MNRFFNVLHLKETHDTYTCTVLQASLKRRKLKDGQYNEQYNKRHDKTVVHRTIQ
jgi:hypothetical protein